MSEELDILRDRHSAKYGELRDAEARLIVVKDKVAGLIRSLEDQATRSLRDVEVQERKVRQYEMR